MCTENVWGIALSTTKWVDVNEGGAKTIWSIARDCARKNLLCDPYVFYGWRNELVAIEQQLVEQVVCQDLIGELLSSMSGMRQEVHNGEKM